MFYQLNSKKSTHFSYSKYYNALIHVCLCAGCACYHDNSWTVNLIQCSGRGHLDVPPLIPMDATTVHLDGNTMEAGLLNPGFIGRRRVTSLFLNARDGNF